MSLAQSFRTSLRSRVVVLRNEQFRRLLGGRAVSVLGDGLYTVAVMWWVYELTGSTAFTGLAGFLSQAPSMFEFLAGPAIDRSRPDRILTVAELTGATFVVVIPIVYLLDYFNVYVLLATIPLVALSTLVTSPAEQASIPLLVEEDRIVRANSMFSMTTELVSATARGLAGILIAILTVVTLFMINALTFVVAAVLFSSLSVPETEQTTESFDLDGYRQELKDGLDLILGSILGLLLVASLATNLLVGIALAVLPAFADLIGGPEIYGLMLASMAIGNVVGALATPVVERLSLGLSTVVGFVCSGIAWLIAVVLADPILTVVLLGVSRVPIGVYNVSIMATLQTGIPDEYLGRLMSIVGSTSNVTFLCGLLFGGLLGDWIGSWTVMFVGGIGILTMGAYWFVVPSLRGFKSPQAVRRGEFV